MITNKVQMMVHNWNAGECGDLLIFALGHIEHAAAPLNAKHGVVFILCEVAVCLLV